MEWPSSRVDRFSIALLLAGGTALATASHVAMNPARTAIVFWVAAALVYVGNFPAVQRQCRSLWNKLLFFYGQTLSSYSSGSLIAVGLLGMLIVGVFFWGTWWFVKKRPLEVIGIAPVDVFWRHSRLVDGKDMKSTWHGVSFVVWVRNGEEVSFINGLSLEGKIHLATDDELRFFIFPDGTGGMPDTTLQGLLKRNPYIVISWSGWPLGKDNKESIRLEPFQDEFIKFTAYEIGQAIPLYSLPLSNYLGYEDGNQNPASVMESVDPKLFFPGLRNPQLLAGRIRDDFRNGAARIMVRAGSQSVVVEPDTIQTVRNVDKEEWEGGSAQEIYFGNRDYKGTKDITPYSPELFR